MSQEILIEGETLSLLPERAVWWEKQRALIVADVHWGKSGHFRKNGIPMPGATQEADALRLAKLVSEYQPQRLIIAGDFFHSRYNEEVEKFTHWRSHHAELRIDFIIGNHDILDKAHYQKWNLKLYPDGMELAPFFIAHDATDVPGFFTVHGHLHPGVRVPGAGSYPAFCINNGCMILPAFSEFTGSKTVQLSTFSQVFVVGEGKVHQVK